MKVKMPLIKGDLRKNKINEATTPKRPITIIYGLIIAFFTSFCLVIVSVFSDSVVFNSSFLFSTSSILLLSTRVSSITVVVSDSISPRSGSSCLIVEELSTGCGFCGVIFGLYLVVFVVVFFTTAKSLSTIFAFSESTD